MGNAVSEFKAELDEKQTRRPARTITPPNEDGSDPRCRSVSPASKFYTPANDEYIYKEFMNLYEDLRDAYTGHGLDDRHMQLEKVLVWMAEHKDWAMEHRLESIVVNFLYKDLPHPPAGYLSLPQDVAQTAQKQHQGIAYAFRPADGSDYNVLYPALGKAGMPYARSVPSAHPLPAFALPDAGLVFDMLLKRDKFVPHPDGVSSLFFAFADLVIHSIFNTDRNDPTINNASSYLDLSPLYGSSEAQVDSVRRKDGTGRLKEDVFADGRLLFMPPSACVLLVLMCRNHNYIADKLLAINERNTFRPVTDLGEVERAKQDDELFQRTRLVNCGFFMQIILGDYVGAILGLVRDGQSWRLKILDQYRTVEHDVAPRGEGNVVSVEFNLMYRWHAAISAQDTAWVEGEFKQMFPGKDLSKLTKADLKALYGRSRPPADVQQWTFGNLARDGNGRFRDVDLAKILQDATEAEAGAFRARGIPEAMKIVELMAIEQERNWGTCSLNEFRRFMGLKPYANFSEWNPDEEIAKAAQMLYHDIENLELYVGLQAEEAKQPGQGAGLCPGYTISRGILADAVCLTRGDRFMTTEFTPQNFTSWGYADCQFDTEDGSYGGMLTKLLFRTLPECYPAGSAYAHFPFLVPHRIRTAIENRDPELVGEYKWTRPTVPSSPVPVSDFPRSEQGLQRRVREITGYEDLPSKELERLLFSAEALKNHRSSFARFTDVQIREQSIAVGTGTRYVDIVRDVINMVPVFWVAAIIQPSAPQAHDGGKHYHPEKYFQGFADLADYVYMNTDHSREFSLRHRAEAVTASIMQHITGTTDLAASDIINRIARRLSAAVRYLEGAPPVQLDDFIADPPCAIPDDAAFLAAMRFAGDTSGLAASFVGELAATAAVYSRSVARLVDALLESKPHLLEEIANADLNVENQRFMDEIHEAISAVNDTGISHGLMDKRFIEATVPAMLRGIFSLPSVQRAAGMSGRLHSLAEASSDEPSGVEVAVYLNSQGHVTPWPTSLTLQYSESQ